jgi:hypothetical protein
MVTTAKLLKTSSRGYKQSISSYLHFVNPCTRSSFCMKQYLIFDCFVLPWPEDYLMFKVPLKAKFVQILFLKMHKRYAKYTFETFTHSWWNNHYLSDRKYGLNKNVFHVHNCSEKPMRKWEYISKDWCNIFRHLSCNHCCRNNIDHQWSAS